MLNANFIKIGLICVLGLAACGEDRSEDPAAQTTEPTMEATSAKVIDLGVIGTFGSDSRRPGDLTQLVLKTNGTFHSATLVECVVPPCDPVQEDGMYKISWRDSRRFITLYNTENVITARYQYEWKDNVLRLLKLASPGVESVPSANWLQMWLSNVAWCANPTASAPTVTLPDDCQLQNLPIGPCAGQWSCVTNACSWSCAAPR